MIYRFSYLKKFLTYNVSLFMADPLQIVSVIVLIKCGSKFLLVRRSDGDDIFPGFWQNMGGKIEVGERVEEAIVREVAEEVGIDVKNIYPNFVHSYSWKKDESSPTRLGLIYLIELQGNIDKHKVNLCSELSDYGWFSIEEVEKLKTIGPDSPTGTLGQLKKAKVLKLFSG
jgi:8-oxo-dGTP pyrophosphatase MutT (NUDIX family)